MAVVTELFQQDVNSHAHIKPVAPSWDAICKWLGEDPLGASSTAHEEWDRAWDQYQDELEEWHRVNGMPYVRKAA